MEKMPNDLQFWRKRIREGAILNPVDRISEVLFGLIMVLTFTGAISVATDGRDDIRELLWAALGCNLAWGLVDAIMYLMNVLFERAHLARTLIRIRQMNDAVSQRNLVRDELPPVLSSLIDDKELDVLIGRMGGLEAPPRRTLLQGRDVLSGLQIFLLVFLCTLPVALPFAIFDQVPFAMRMSNAIALMLLFAAGYKLAVYSGLRPLLTAVSYAAIGIGLVLVTILLGG